MSAPRREDQRLFRGEGASVGDAGAPNWRWMRVVRSADAHATVRAVDAAAIDDALGNGVRDSRMPVHPEDIYQIAAVARTWALADTLKNRNRVGAILMNKEAGGNMTTRSSSTRTAHGGRSVRGADL